MNIDDKIFNGQNVKILNLLRCYKGLDKTKLSKLLNVTWPTISKNIDDLKQYGILYTKGNEILIKKDSFSIAGISIGSAQTKFTLVDSNFDPFLPSDFSHIKKALVFELSNNSNIKNPNSEDKYIYFTTPSTLTELKDILDKIYKVVLDYSDKLNIIALGIVSTGAIDRKQNLIIKSHNLEYLSGLTLANLFYEDKLLAMKKNNIYISLEQNSTAACIAEKYKLYKDNSAYAQNKNIVSLYLGAGIGAGFILDNKIYYGTSGFSGEVGHITAPIYLGKKQNDKDIMVDDKCSCGKDSCYDYRIRTDVFEKTRELFSIMTTEEIYEALLNNEEKKEILGFYLGQLTNMLMNILNPDLIIFTGKFYKSMDLLWKYISKVRDENQLRFISNDCTMTSSDLGALSPTIGAAICAYHNWLDINMELD